MKRFLKDRSSRCVNTRSSRFNTQFGSAWFAEGETCELYEAGL